MEKKNINEVIAELSVEQLAGMIDHTFLLKSQYAFQYFTPFHGSKGFFYFFYRKAMRDKVGCRKSALFNPLCQCGHCRPFFGTGRPLMHVQVEVIRSLSISRKLDS